ncbi:MAG TPA: hypothetical protein VFJ58_25365 [Armatimonadota bacterium]|nr:hypothetical protein [Armatimonadota bacterium]
MTLTTSAFPATDDFARAFFEEAAWHVTDSLVSHQNERTACSVTSAMKAAELGIKAALIHENAMGLYKDLFATHKPLTLVEQHPILRRLLFALDGKRDDLSRDIKGMEILEPTAFGAKGYDPIAGEANTEYPFLGKERDATGIEYTQLRSPQEYFKVDASLEKYRLARELLVALSELYPGIAEWGIEIPAAL